MRSCLAEFQEPPCLGERLADPAQVLVIGGAAMLEYGLKDVTRDIDLICRDEAGKVMLLDAARDMGFQIIGPEKRHARLTDPRSWHIFMG